MSFPQVWITDEQPPRYLIAKGRSALDPDCLVAELGGGQKSLWIVDDGGPTTDEQRAKGSCVCGLGENVRARLISPISAPPPEAQRVEPNK